MKVKNISKLSAKSAILLFGLTSGLAISANSVSAAEKSNNETPVNNVSNDKPSVKIKSRVFRELGPDGMEGSGSTQMSGYGQYHRNPFIH